MQTYRKFSTFQFLLAISLLLNACGGGGGGTGGSGGGTVAGGGTGGTGVGTVSGFSSIIINETSIFELNNRTRISIDGEDAIAEDLKIGMIVQYDVGRDANPGFTRGTATRVSASYQVKGPVTNVSPLEVLGQSVVVTGSTILTAIPGDTTQNLSLGDALNVAGYSGPDAVIRASLLEGEAGGIAEWKVVGRATSVNAAGFSIGNQQIDLNGIIAENCGSGLSDGDTVDVRASNDPAFVSGDTLTSTLSVECKPTGLQVPSNPVGDIIEAEIEGIVSEVNSATEFIVNGQRVVFSESTQFEGGSSIDIVVGAKLEAEGVFDTGNQLLSADEIKFKEKRVKMLAPVETSDIVVGVSLQAFGITVFSNQQTEDDDDIIRSGNGNVQAEIDAFIDGSGNVIAIHISDQGAIDFNKVNLRGPASNISPPTFEILGVSIDTNTATEISSGFFDQISEGSSVKIEEAVWDGGKNLTGGNIELEN